MRFASEEIEVVADCKVNFGLGGESETAGFAGNEVVDFEFFFLNRGNFGFADLLLIVHNANEIAGFDIAFRDFPAGDNASLLGTENAFDFHFAFIFLYNFSFEEIFHFVLGIINQLVDDFVNPNGDAIAGGHFGNVNWNIDVKAVNYSVATGGHINVVLADIADAGMDDVEGDFATSINQFEAVYNRGD